MLVFLSVPGCFSVDARRSTEGATYYLGLVRLTSDEQDNVQRNAVQSVGARIKDGFTLGYVDERKLLVPRGCQVIVFVRTAEDLQHADALFKTLKGEGLCTVRDSD
ncbi:hypothetical protein [Pseudomonas chlororaphis]|uniref:hypothetical protein n=1 Tax=Pseudomonas chlororaphis TaxID=587753 RepID=UPI0011D16CEB|nr:hypothetical protein [Pseudomonas chlororaphis]